MAFTPADRDALKKAITRGIKTVAYTDRRMEYRSLAEMLQALEMIEAELAPKRRASRIYMGVSTGIRTE